MVNYVKLAALAQKLITANGRELQVIRNARTPTDPTKPWRGNTTPRNPPDEVYDVFGVFVPLTSSKRFLGIEQILVDENKRPQMSVLIAAQGIDKDLSEFDEIIDDDGSHWAITNGQMLRPGATRMVYAFGVRR